MTHPEFSESSYDDLDKELLAMLSGANIEYFGDDAIESLDTERDALIQCLLDHLSASDAHEITDIAMLSDLRSNLTDILYKDFNSLTRMRMYDRITASGDTLAIVTGQSDNSVEESAIVLSDESRICGTVFGLMLHDIPPIQAIDKIKNDESDAVRADEGQPTLYPFGLSLGLRDVRYEDLNGNTTEFPEGYHALIPLNYPGLKLGHIIKQEA